MSFWQSLEWMLLFRGNNNLVVQSDQIDYFVKCHIINETLVPGMIFMGNWAVHNFNEYLWANLSVSCIEVSFLCMLMHENNILMPRYFHACMIFLVKIARGNN